jgi:hypothetical protein
MIVGACVLGLGSRRYDAVRIAMLAAALFFTWYSSRTVSIGGVLAAVLVADGLERLLPTEQATTRASARHEIPGLLAWTAACLVALALVVPHTSDDPAGVPTAFDPQLDALPAGTVVFNNYETGGWLAWRHPNLDHYIDPLADAYPVSHLQRYLVALEADPGWLRILRSSEARVALLQVGEPLTSALLERGWTVRGRSAGYVLLMSRHQ